MADLSDKARRLLSDTINTDPQDWKKNETELRRYVASLEAVARAARSFRSVMCAINSRQLDEALRRLDGAGEGDGNG